MLLFNHFLDLAEVCDPEQRIKFESVIHELLEMIRPREPLRKPPEKGTG